MTALVLNPGRKRRRNRKSGKRWTPAARRAFAVKMAKYRKGGRKSRRKLAANDWPGDRLAHSAAAIKGWYGRGVMASSHVRWKRKKHRKASRNGKLHGKAKAAFLRMMASGRRKGRRGKPSFIRRIATKLDFSPSRAKHNNGRRHRNPAATLRLGTGRLMAGLKPGMIMGVAPIAAGAIANLWLTPRVASYLPAGWQSGIRKSVVGLLSAGGIAAISGMAAPRFAAKLAVGAVAQTVIEAAARMIGGGVAARAPAPVAVAQAAEAKAARVAGFDGTWAPEFEGGSGISGFEYFGEEMEETFN